MNDDVDKIKRLIQRVYDGSGLTNKRKLTEYLSGAVVQGYIQEYNKDTWLNYADSWPYYNK